MAAKYSHSDGLRTDSLDDELSEVLEFWFPNSYYQDHWFAPLKDDEIRVRFSDLLHQLEMMDVREIIEWLDHPGSASHANTDRVLAVVICLDQFSRNIYRGTDEIYRNDAKCIQILEFFQKRSLEVPINRRIFLLLPFRHQKKTHLLDRVMESIKRMEAEIEQYESAKSHSIRQIKEYRAIVTRFKNATLRDYSKVVDTVRHLRAEDWKDRNIPLPPPETRSHIVLPGTTNLAMIMPVLDPVCHEYQSISSGSELPYDTAEDTKVYRILKEFYVRRNIRHATISLSGGVDSMVISHAMHHIRLDGVLDSISAVHVDYGNREVSLREAQVVEAWCKFLRIPLITRRIEHMRRNDDKLPVDRALYESATKELRFNLYRHAMKEYDSTSIALGHHADDLSENVLMNTIRGGDLLDLFTMVDHQVIDGVPIDRPLLPIGKDEIYRYAKEFEVPYLADTTSESCMRGTVRKKVIPSLKEVDPSIRQSLMDIGRQSAEWKGVIDSMVIAPILSKFTIGKFGAYLKWKDEYADLPLIVWSTVLCDVFHKKIGVRMIKHQNLQQMHRWMKTQNGLIGLSNGFMGVFHDSHLILIRQGIASLIQKLPQIEGGFPNSYAPVRIPPTPGVIHYNGWKISYGFDDTDHDHTRTLQISDLIAGRFELSYRPIFAPIGSKILEKAGVDCDGLHGCLTYGMALTSKAKKKSDNRTFFSNLDLNRYIPKLHFFTTDEMESRFITIRYSYE